MDQQMHASSSSAFARSSSPAAQIPSSPTEEYLSTSLLPSTPISNPLKARKLLILDLNGTLLLRAANVPRPREHRRGKPEPPRNKDQPRLRPVHPRPFMPSFRSYLFHLETRKWLDTMVWSSAQPHSVNDMVQKCFEERQNELVAIWARDTLGLAASDYYQKTQTTKDLAKPWEKISIETGSPHSANTTLLLDDSPLKAHLQPYNHVCIAEYTGDKRFRDLGLYNETQEETREAEQAVRDWERAQKREQWEKDFAARKAAGTHESLEKWEERIVRKFERAYSPSVPQPPYEGAGRVAVEPEVEEQDVVAEEIVAEEPAAPVVVEEELAASATGLSPNPKKRKRKGKKDKDSAKTRTTPVDAIPDYDATLLAVIGVLHTLKSQSNVSGWIRSGGLWVLGKPDQPDAAEGEEAGNDEAADMDEVMWFQDPPTIASWAEQGKAALKEMGIPVEPGVTVHPR